MLNKNKIKGLLLDYGGTIDTNGIHWAIVLWQCYQNLNIQVNHDAFNEAYIHGERSLALNPYIKPEHNFYDVLYIKAKIQLEYLIEKKYLENINIEVIAKQIAEHCYNFTKKTIETAKDTLDYLYGKYPIILVSNFYGNIHTVLKDFNINYYFKEIIESAVVGVRKPDPAIWALGINALKVNAGEAVVIGDSYSKDIISGKQAGCQTIWLDVSGWDKIEDKSQADEIIINFTVLKNLL